ncbi:MAG: hypothetical protein HYT98_01650 [Candidatus Sungbacteria bacterium]|nr:hypothetical protein [Candidatus Sungbacteria bacterium]
MPTITIPKKITNGNTVTIPRKEYEDLLRIARIIPKSQEWFWSAEWQKKEHEAENDIKFGKMSKPYRTRRELVFALHKLKKQ